MSKRFWTCPVFRSPASHYDVVIIMAVSLLVFSAFFYTFPVCEVTRPNPELPHRDKEEMAFSFHVKWPRWCAASVPCGVVAALLGEGEYGTDSSIWYRFKKVEIILFLKGDPFDKIGPDRGIASIVVRRAM